jgi:hypothetical protein
VNFFNSVDLIPQVQCVPSPHPTPQFHHLLSDRFSTSEAADDVEDRADAGDVEPQLVLQGARIGHHTRSVQDTIEGAAAGWGRVCVENVITVKKSPALVLRNKREQTLGMGRLSQTNMSWPLNFSHPPGDQKGGFADSSRNLLETNARLVAMGQEKGSENRPRNRG